MNNEDASNKPVELSDSMMKKALQSISGLRDQLLFFSQLIASRNLYEDSVRTHMNLFRSQYDDLAQCFELNVLSEELEDAYASCRQANARIAELEKHAGDSINARNALSRLKHIEEWFQSWYTLCGFQYARIEWNSFGMHAEFSEDVDKPDSDRVGDHMGDKEFKARVIHVVPFIFDNQWDLRKDSFHDEILDTERNRHNIKDLVRQTFPDARVIKLYSRIDHTDYLLRFEIDISWDDIERWHERILLAAEQTPSYTSGIWFAKLAGLRHNLSDERTYRRYASPEVIREDEKELKRLEDATSSWYALVTLATRDGRDAIHSPVTITVWGASRDFETGTPYSTIESWLAEILSCDITKDLAGCESRPWDNVRVTGEQS